MPLGHPIPHSRTSKETIRLVLEAFSLFDPSSDIKTMDSFVNYEFGNYLMLDIEFTYWGVVFFIYIEHLYLSTSVLPIYLCSMRPNFQIE